VAKAASHSSSDAQRCRQSNDLPSIFLPRCQSAVCIIFMPFNLPLCSAALYMPPNAQSTRCVAAADAAQHIAF